MDSKFVNLAAVRSAMRALGLACPACGRPILRDEEVLLHGVRYHRGCAFYSSRRVAR